MEERKSYVQPLGRIRARATSNVQAEVEKQRRQNQELSQARVKLEAELANLQDKLDNEMLGRNEETGVFNLCLGGLIM